MLLDDLISSVNVLILQYSYIFEDEEDGVTIEADSVLDEKSEKSDETSEKSLKSAPSDMVRFLPISHIMTTSIAYQQLLLQIFVQ